MRSTLFLSTLFATALFGGTALAERSGDETSANHHVASARDAKERITHESTDKHDTSTSQTTRTEKAPAKVEVARPKGDNYEQYGHRPAGAAVHTVTTTNPAASKMPANLLPGRSHGDVVDPQGRKRTAAPSSIQATVGSTQMTWSAGGKSVRSFVHFTNDKGQTNNNIHGSTATAAKMRLCAKIIMGTAGTGLMHVFSWQTAGGDSQSLFPG